MAIVAKQFLFVQVRHLSSVFSMKKRIPLIVTRSKNISEDAIYQNAHSGFPRSTCFSGTGKSISTAIQIPEKTLIISPPPPTSPPTLALPLLPVLSLLPLLSLSDDMASLVASTEVALVASTEVALVASTEVATVASTEVATVASTAVASVASTAVASVASTAVASVVATATSKVNTQIPLIDSEILLEFSKDTQRSASIFDEDDFFNENISQRV